MHKPSRMPLQGSESLYWSQLPCQVSYQICPCILVKPLNLTSGQDLNNVLPSIFFPDEGFLFDVKISVGGNILEIRTVRFRNRKLDTVFIRTGRVDPFDVIPNVVLFIIFLKRKQNRKLLIIFIAFLSHFFICHSF